MTEQKQVTRAIKRISQTEIRCNENRQNLLSKIPEQDVT